MSSNEKAETWSGFICRITSCLNFFYLVRQVSCSCTHCTSLNWENAYYYSSSFWFKFQYFQFGEGPKDRIPFSWYNVKHQHPSECLTTFQDNLRHQPVFVVKETLSRQNMENTQHIKISKIRKTDTNLLLLRRRLLKLGKIQKKYTKNSTYAKQKQTCYCWEGGFSSWASEAGSRVLAARSRCSSGLWWHITI